MSKYFDYQFGLAEVVPSKQNEKEGDKVSAFRSSVEKTIIPQIMNFTLFPSKKEVFVAILQFFISKKEYQS